MPAFSYEINSDGVAILTFDLPGQRVNILTTAVMEELNRVVDEIRENKQIRALVFRSGKSENFIAGADISEIKDIRDSETGERLARTGQTILAKLENLPFPTVAAIHGACMGGGLELALSCTYRVVSNDPKTVLALPEVRLGIIPGFGGTQRLPRLVGLSNALEMILTGKSVYARKARKMGLADEAVYKEILLKHAVGVAIKAMGRKKSGRIRARRSPILNLIEENRFAGHFIFRMARKNILKETRGNYPAPLAALDSVQYGFLYPGEDGYRNEAQLLGRLAPSEVSKNLVSVYYLNEMLKKSTDPAPSPIAGAAVLGAGVMGGGIAQLLAEKGINVRMKDINAKAVAAGLREAWTIFRKRRKRGILTAIQARDGFDRITGATDYSGLTGTHIAIEAVVESMEVKKSVLREFEAAAGANAIFASNTSSLSITEMATASQRPEKVAGMHFFNPVEKMPLVEVIRGKETSDETVAAIKQLSHQIGKLPVVVNDGPGFLVNRILMPYLGEAVALLEQGGKIEEIDTALLDFGMPMGAFILLDEIGIDIASKVSQIFYQGLGNRAKPSGLLDALYKEGYYGKKNGKGFYRYENGRRGEPDMKVYEKIETPPGRGSLGPTEIIDRTILLMIKEAALCLEEKIIDRPDLLDAALIFGIGFPPFRGGLLKYADKIGAKTIVEKLETYARKYGERFNPPGMLTEFAMTGKTFYPVSSGLIQNVSTAA